MNEREAAESEVIATVEHGEQLLPLQNSIVLDLGEFSYKISDALVIDMAPDGTIYGIAMLNANEQIKGEDWGEILFVNEAMGFTREIPLHAD